MAVERLSNIRGTGIPAARRRHRHRSHHPGAVSEVVTFDGLEEHLFEDDRQQLERRTPGHPFESGLRRRAAIMLVQRELRLRLVARACAAGDPPLGHPRDRRRVVRRDLLRQLGGARHAVPDGVAASVSSADGARSSRTRRRTDRDRSRRDDESRPADVASSSRCRRGPRSVPDGTWDATGLLLEHYDEVGAVAARLPYVTGTGKAGLRQRPEFRRQLLGKPRTPDSGLLPKSPLLPSPTISRNACRGCARRPAERRAAPAAAPSSGTGSATSSPRAISVSAQRRGSSATPIPISTARLIPSRLGSDIRMLIGVRAAVRRRAARDRAPATGRCARSRSARPISSMRHRAVSASGCVGPASSTSSSAPSDMRLHAAVGRLEGQHAEVEAALELAPAICRDGTRRTSTATFGCCRRNRAMSGSRRAPRPRWRR